jgi:Holliday junction DNA helicase RuvB
MPSGRSAGRSSGRSPGNEIDVGKGLAFKLVRGLPPKMLAQELQFFRRFQDVGPYAVGFYLQDMHERREHETFGAPTTEDWAVRNLDMKNERTAREYRQVFRELQRLPELHEAFKKGQIRWARVRLLIRVATPETDREWLEFGLENHCRRIEREVKGRKKGDQPRKKGKLGTPQPNAILKYEVSLVVKAIVDDYMERRLLASPPGTTPEDILKGIALGEIGGGEPLNRPRVVFLVNPEGDCWRNTKEGPVPVPREEVLELAGDNVVYLPLPPEGEYPAIPFGERGSVPPSERDDPTPAAIREAVFQRDGYSCVLCRSRKNLRGHHLKSRAHGGETRVEGMCTLCLSCHSLAHAGLLTICVDRKGCFYAKDRWGRRLDEGISPAEALRDAPPGRSAILIETDPDPEPADVDDPGARAPVPSGGVSDPDGCVSDPDTDRGARAPVPSPEAEIEPASDNSSPSPSRRDVLRAIESAQSIERIPSRLTRDEWHALSGRLEWSRGRGELVFHPDREAAPPREPAPVPEREDGRKLSGLIGQKGVRACLGDLVLASRTLGEPLPSLLFEGPPGLGKSSFARAMAEEMGVGIQVVTGSNLRDPKEAMSLLTGLGRNDILFIDEIHAVDKKVLECFYPALEERVFQWTVHEGPRSKSIEVRLEPFTFMGATTEEGMLPEPLRSRFTQVIRLERYSDPEMEGIANLCASLLSTSISPEACRELARRARGTPRIVRNFVLSVRAHAKARGRDEIDLASVLEFMDAQGIDSEGLGRPEREILRYLLEVGRPIGLKAVAAALRMDARTIERVHEPYLIEKGFVVRTSRGRVATEKARAHLAQAKAA